jgi:predicted RNA-binding protein YlxR (DUF448 family)
LVRVVRRPDGTVALDRDGTLEGRGAYLCADEGCWEVALKRSALQRALRTSLPTDLRTHLEHGDVNAIRVATDHVAPAMITGGTDGT